MTDSAPTLEELVKGIQASRNFAYVDMAGITIISFDWILNLGSEIRLIWNAKGTPMKVIYLLTRYVPIAYSITVPLYSTGKYTTSECATLYIVDGALFMSVGFCADLVLIIRTWAVWGKGKYITYFLFGLYALALVSQTALYAVSQKFTQHFTFPSPVFGCYPEFDSSILPAAFVIHTVLDTVILVLMLIRGASLYWWGKNSTLLRTIYSDGISFYVYNAVLSVAMTIMLFGKSDNSLLLWMIEGAFTPVLACRVVLHIRRSYNDTLEVETLSTTKNTRIFATNGQRSMIE